VIDIVEILQHWHAGRPKAVVARSVGVDRSTVDKYVAAAIAAGLSPGGASLSRAVWSELVRKWFPELVEARSRSLTFSSIHEHHDRIEEMLKTNTATTVHQRLRDEHGLSVSISSFRRYLWLEFPDEVTADKVTVPRPAIEPGDEAQIDYGLLGMWSDPLTGRRRRVWAFVMVLTSSRHMFVRPVLRMDQQSFVACHVAAFEFFGGCAKRLVPDNPKTAVTHPDLYDPKINRAYAEMASHYDCLVDPARAGKPKDKGLASHCTSCSRFDQNSTFELASHAFHECRVIGPRRSVESFVLVVRSEALEQTGLVPLLDGRCADREPLCHLVEAEKPASTQALGVAREMIAAA